VYVTLNNVSILLLHLF